MTTVVTTLPPGVKLYTPPHVVAATYNVNLLSAPGPGREPAGEPGGSGLAVITIDPATNEFCWSFSGLKNVTAPTDARLYPYEPGELGREGLRLGAVYKPSGCIGLLPQELVPIERRPPLWVISIHTARFPAGAVRGRI